MPRTARALPVVILSVAVAALLPSCSGPQPLDGAIAPDDERTYLAMVSDELASPRDAWLRSEARRRDVPVDVVAAEDAELSETKNPFDARHDPGAVSRGAVLYKHQCARCHGEHADGRGPDMPVTMPSMDFHRPGMRFAVTVHGGAPRSWFAAISDGVVVGSPDPAAWPDPLEMPAFADVMTREQIWLVITYLQSLDANMQASAGDAS